jgi:anti-anti-sigma regulatory factor
MNNVKSDTKEKFTVVKPLFISFSANLAEELVAYLETFLKKEISNVVLDLSSLQDITEKEAALLMNVQHQFYENQSSFIICEVVNPLQHLFKECMNITPTESEAWDIVQMEEMERELLNNFNDL